VNTNVAEVLRVCDREDVPIYSGAALPFVRTPDYEEGAKIHGSDGINEYWKRHVIGEFPHKKPEAEPAAVAIIRLANELEGELNIVTIGPLTNLALAL
jgi:purine nucleosidase